MTVEELERQHLIYETRARLGNDDEDDTDLDGIAREMIRRHCLRLVVTSSGSGDGGSVDGVYPLTLEGEKKLLAEGCTFDEDDTSWEEFVNNDYLNQFRQILPNDDDLAAMLDLFVDNLPGVDYNNDGCSTLIGIDLTRENRVHFTLTTYYTASDESEEWF